MSLSCQSIRAGSPLRYIIDKAHVGHLAGIGHRTADGLCLSLMKEGRRLVSDCEANTVVDDIHENCTVP